jgi:uncharacterized protein (TIGR02611 family)
MSAAPERRRPERPGEPALVRKLRARQAEHKKRGRLYRWTFVAVGVAVLGVGIAMLALPGPAFVVIPILSLEFAWAEHLLEKALIKGEEAKRRASEASPAQKALTGAAAACAVAAAVTAAILWDIPLLPV